MENIKIDPHECMANWYVTKEKRQYYGRKVVYSTNGAGTTEYLHEKKNEARTRPSTPKTHSKRFTANYKTQNYKILETNIWQTLDEPEQSMTFR